MKTLLRISDLSEKDILEIFDIADHIEDYANSLAGKRYVTYFPETSIRTMVTFETAIMNLGARTIRFPSEALDKEEPMEDVASYLNNWTDGLIVRHSSEAKQEELAAKTEGIFINAMSRDSHPCEILSDLYSFRSRNVDIKSAIFVFVGEKGNIGNSYFQASQILGFKFIQVCKPGDEIPGAEVSYSIEEVIGQADAILTDSLGKDKRESYKRFIIDENLLTKAKENVLINPCPPFHRGFEVSEAVISSKAFVGYDFKKSLERIQEAIIIFLSKE